MESNLSADNDRQVGRRERFASPLAVALVVGTGLALLVALYPEREIVSLLSRSGEPSPAVLRYLEALTRIRPNDQMLKLELAAIYLKIECPEKALESLKDLDCKLLEPEGKLRFEKLRYQATVQQLYFADPDEPEWGQARSEYAAIVEDRIKKGASRSQIGGMLADAEMLGDSATRRRLEVIVGPSGPQGMRSGDAEADEVAGKPLAAGNYRAASEAYISFIPQRKSLPEKRRLFIAALASLQSGNMPLDALSLGERQIGPLRDDRETLVFLTRLALAANRPEIAQKYVKRALGMKSVEAAR